MTATSKATPAVHVWPARVYFEDTDAGGVVYYANYLKFVERARTEFLRAEGLDHTALARDYGINIVVRRCAIEFIASAHLDDALEIRSHVVALGGASVTMRQEIFRRDQMLAAADVRLACVGAGARPARWPEALKRAFGGGSSSAVTTEMPQMSVRQAR